jgi:hypothetical protein
MKIEEMIAKSSVKGGRIASKSLSKVTSGSSENDFVQDGLIARIIEGSNKGYYDNTMSENAIYVIMEVCTVKDGKVNPTGEAVQVYLSMFDRVAVPYLVDAEGDVVRDSSKDTVRASGSVVDTWKRAANAEAFMTANKDKAMKFTLDAKVEVRAWDRAANAFSTTRTREQKVYKIDWV